MSSTITHNPQLQQWPISSFSQDFYDLSSSKVVKAQQADLVLLSIHYGFFISLLPGKTRQHRSCFCNFQCIIGPSLISLAFNKITINSSSHRNQRKSCITTVLENARASPTKLAACTFALASHSQLESVCPRTGPPPLSRAVSLIHGDTRFFLAVFVCAKTLCLIDWNHLWKISQASSRLLLLCC